MTIENRSESLAAVRPLVPEFLRRSSYRRLIRGGVRRLGLQLLARRLYYRAITRGTGTAPLVLAGRPLRFSVGTPAALRMLEDCSYEDALQVLLRGVSRDDIVLDVGAQYGLYAVALSPRVRQVIAIEPDPGAFNQLRRNIALNGLTNVDVQQCALSDHEGTATLRLGRELGKVAVMDAVPITVTDEYTTAEVPIARGDALMKRLGSTPTLIKIDVEGYESYVLDGLHDTLRNPACRIVCCEIHPANLPPGETPDRILARITDAGLTRVARLPRRTELHVICSR